MKLLVFDPSGNYDEGSGTTGWAFFEHGDLKEFGDRKADNYGSPEGYWDSHVQLIDNFCPDVVVYETYKLQAGKAMQQSWSQLETPQLIGIIRWTCWMRGIICKSQDPFIRQRFNDDVLVHTGVAEKRGKLLYIHDRRTNDHMRDAIRHGLYFQRYGKMV